MTARSKQCVVHVAHKLKHRTRLKVDRKHRSPQNLQRVKAALEQTQGVKEVSINSTTGSLVVHHGAGTEVTHKFQEILSGLMCECVEVAVEAVEPELAPAFAIFTKLLPVAEEANPGLSNLVVPVGFIAIGFVGAWHARAILSAFRVSALAEFVPFL